VGGGLLLAVLVTGVRAARRGSVRGDRATWIGGAAATAAFAVHGAVDFLWHLTALPLLAATVFAAVLAAPAETVPAETVPAETVPAETVPAETAPAGGAPVDALP
jgi:hypothetical protein